MLSVFLLFIFWVPCHLVYVYPYLFPTFMPNVYSFIHKVLILVVFSPDLHFSSQTTLMSCMCDILCAPHCGAHSVLLCPQCPIISTRLVYLWPCAPFVLLSDCCGQYVLVLLFLALSCCSLWFLLFFSVFFLLPFLDCLYSYDFAFFFSISTPFGMVPGYDACYLTRDLALL